MNTKLLILALLHVAIIGCKQNAEGVRVTPDTAPDVQSTPPSIVGTWKVKFVERFKEEVPQLAGQTWTFDATNVTIALDDWSETVTYKINEDQSPKTIEIGPRDSKRSQVGLYSISDRELKLCLIGWDEPLPKDFATADGENQSLLVLVRQ
jgi:uncharacterized protein (TIGR03067 family)